MTQPLDSAPVDSGQLTEAHLTVARPWGLPVEQVLAHLEADAAGLRTADAAGASRARRPQPPARAAAQAGGRCASWRTSTTR